MSLAPVALFAFNRPVHLRRTIASLQQCEGFADTRVVVFGDGPRGARDEADVQATRKAAQELLGSSAEYRFAERNQGLARSIVGGVESLLAAHGRVIVVEDDLLLSSSFLAFMNHALDHYASDERVFQVSGHMFDVHEFAQREEALLLPLTTTWGWATWSRAWKAFDAQAPGWEALLNDAALRRRFNLDGAYDYAHMLQRQMAGQRQSWGISWCWNVFSRGGLGCFPPRSLVANAGMDGSGTHGRGRFRSFESRVLPSGHVSFQAPAAADVEADAWGDVRRTIWRQNGGWLGYAVDRLRRLRWSMGMGR